MGRSRLFIAASLSQKQIDAATRLQKELAKSGAEVKWVAPNALHLTLIFLGEVDDKESHAICRATSNAVAEQGPFTVRLSGVGAFPSLRRPKVIWAGLNSGSDELGSIQQRLEESLFELGCYRKEDRPYTPHLTLGRAKDEAAGTQLVDELPKYSAWTGGETILSELGIYSSELRREGPNYTLLGRARFGS